MQKGAGRPSASVLTTYVARARWLLVASVVFSAAAARADEGIPSPVRLVFDVDEGLTGQCPDRASFVALLRSERPRLALVPDDANARRFDVHVRRASRDELDGELVVTERDGTTSTRSVHARDCRTLVRALAVVAAVATDLVAESEPPPPVTTTAPPPNSPPNLPPRPMPRRPARARVPPKTERAIVIAAGAGSEVVLGALPRTTLGYRAYVEAQHHLGSNFDGRLRTSFAFARAELSGTTGLDVAIQIWSARVEPCLSRRVFAPLSVEACASATFGAFHSYSTGSAAAARDDVRPWLTFGSGLRARWHLSRAFHAELFGNASYVSKVYLTIARDETAATHRVPRGIGEIGLGVGYSFDGP